MDKYLFVYFTSYVEKNRGIFKLLKCLGNVYLFCDYKYNWFDNSLNKIIDKINKYILKNNIDKIILFGSSSGGYAALYCSNFINNSICFSFNPQTFNKNNTKILQYNNSIIKNKIINFPTSESNIFNLRKIIKKQNNNSKKYILVGSSECDDKSYWQDTLYAGYLLGLKNVIILITPTNIHAGWKNVIPLVFYKLIYDNYDILVNSHIEGGKILNEKIEYWITDKLK